MGKILVSEIHFMLFIRIINFMKSLQNLMIIFIRKNFLDWILDLEDFFGYMNILEERNVNFLSINTVGTH